MTIDDLLQRAVERGPERVALTWRGLRLSFAELDRAVDAAVARLGDVGVSTDDRVAIVAGNVPALAVLLFATWRAGAVALPLNDRLRSDDLGSAFAATVPTITAFVERADAGADADRRARLLETTRIERRQPAGDAAPTTTASAVPAPPGTGLILTTSGSTGTPKPVLVAHQRELDTAASLTDRLSLTPDDVTVLAVSLTHAFGLSCFLAAIASGGESILVDSTTSTGPLLDAASTATVLHGSPTLFTSVASAARPLPPRVRTGLSAGAAAPPGLLERLDDAGLTICNLYGMTELGATAATRPDDPAPVRWTTAGTALPGHELRIVDGELFVRGRHVTAGYYGQPERTARAFTEDGWFRTGDTGTLDDAGNLTVLGRLDDIVSIAGFTVSPAEVEACLLGHPDAIATVVVAVPDARLGHRLSAFVVPRPRATVSPRDLVGHVRQRLAGYKVPYRVEFMDDLPRLANGKPDRHTLRARAIEAERR